MRPSLRLAAAILIAACLFALSVPELRDRALVALLAPVLFKVLNTYLEQPLSQLRAAEREAQAITARARRLLGR